MNWEDAIPNIAIAQAARATEPAMDSHQFAAFYQRSSRPLWAYLARASGDPALADDLMQESYVRFLTATSPPDGEVAARMYLFRIASNLLRDHWRRHRAIAIEDLPKHSSAANPPAPDSPLPPHWPRHPAFPIEALPNPSPAATPPAPATSAQPEARLTLLPALAK